MRRTIDLARRLTVGIVIREHHLQVGATNVEQFIGLRVLQPCQETPVYCKRAEAVHQPSMCTRHMRHAEVGSIFSSLHRFGISSIPLSIATLRIVCPS